jgi:hypothetical protein
MAGIATGVTLDEEKRASLDDELTPAEPANRPTEHAYEAASRAGASERVSDPAGQYATPAARSVARGEQPSDLVEDLLPVRPADHEAEESAHFLVGQAAAPSRVILVRANLALDHIAEPEPPRHGPHGILVFQELTREVSIPNDLQEPERDDGLYTSGAVGRARNLT